ncbi:hypothetical protein GO495_20245 [Chitinophaga oryziterrae]|uniref:Uncharacterized protein n=1 Tax=Chitinophaga oryziterrae TaxID=1031224 RepID=A0A6N8JF36_9BACT|nr:hypothetical protein [Chitinophaga oryziterrae]MVT42938.1 hypothetical protein [Chitinophaga oryziterrae]
MSDRTDLRDRLYEKLCKDEQITTYRFVWEYTTKITNTAILRYKYQKLIKDDLQEQILKQRISMKIARIICSAIFIVLICLMTHSFFEDGVPTGWSLFTLVVFNLFVGTMTFGMLYSLKRNNQIEISSQQIKLEEKTFSWDHILDMYIIIKPIRGSKYDSYNYILALLLDTGEIYRYSLDEYTIAAEEFTWEVSAYLEHFRNRQNRIYQ